MVAPLGTRQSLTVYDGVRTGQKVAQAAKDLKTARTDLRSKGVRQTTLDAWERAGVDARSPTGNLRLGGKLKLGAGGFDLVRGVTRLPGQVGTASSSVRQAVRTGSRQDVANAVSSVSTAGSTAAGVVSDGLSSAQTANKLWSSYRYGRDAFVAAAPLASPSLARAAGRAAASQTFQGATHAAAVSATRSAVKSAATSGSASVARAVGTATRPAANAVLRTAGKEAAEAALKGGARAAAGTLGKAAGRFVPGMNIAIATFDTANAAATWADPKASMGKKLGNSVTALGSIAAATNIPVVSQVGAGVSAVSSFVTSFF